MKKNWMYGSMVDALFAVLASSCGNSQQVLDFRGPQRGSFFAMTEKVSDE